LLYCCNGQLNGDHYEQRTEKEKIRRLAKSRGVSQKHIVLQLVDQALDKEEKQPMEGSFYWKTFTALFEIFIPLWKKMALIVIFPIKKIILMLIGLSKNITICLSPSPMPAWYMYMNDPDSRIFTLDQHFHIYRADRKKIPVINPH